MPVSCIFLDWNQPLIAQLTERLLGSAAAENLVDLSQVLVIVPTVQSGRRLREALALGLGDRAGGLFPPSILTPDQILADALRDQPLASEASMRAAWVAVLERIDLAHFTALFPVEPDISPAWKLGMAQRLMQLRSELSEDGLDLTLAAQRAAEAGHEVARWEQLARLEGLYLDTLKFHGLSDPKKARAELAECYSPPPGIESIVLAATPDAQALPLRALARASEAFPIEVWIYGPKDANAFDQWGRPNIDFWETRQLALEKWGLSLQLYPNPRPLGESIAEDLKQAAPESTLVGISDPKLAASVSDALESARIPCYDPEGQALHLCRLGQLAEWLCQISADASIAVVRSLLQQPDVHNWLGADRQPGHFLNGIDQLFEKHLAADLDALLFFAQKNSAHSELYQALTKLKDAETALQKNGKFATALLLVLRDIYEGTRSPAQEPDQIPWNEQAEALSQLLQTIQETEMKFKSLSNTLARESFRMSLQKTHVYPDRTPESHDLLGWLELLWNDAPHLILAGMNEGAVPEAVVGDTFLPESLRAHLGLRTNSQRLSRDAYLLEALCQRRTNGRGRIDVRIPQTATDGTPLRPSRLLFLGKPDTLLPRARQLFRETKIHRQPSLHTAAWKLRPPPGLPLPDRLSVSALKSYLQCPFRFFLRYILKMRPLDTSTRELSPAAFGNVFHDTVAQLRGQILDTETRLPDLEKRLLAIAYQLLNHRYGTKRSFALRLQGEALKSRILAFCQRQIEDIARHGPLTILETEVAFSSITLENMPIIGRIDRIDQRENHLALIDYKTGDSPIQPEKAHLAAVARKAPPAHLPQEAFFQDNEKTFRWIDLQLPLYLLSQQNEKAERPKLAYFNLSKTLDKSGIERWDNFTLSHLESAQACGAALIRQIRNGVFWPPSPDIRQEYDDFACCFPDGIENSIEAECFKKYPFVS